MVRLFPMYILYATQDFMDPSYLYNISPIVAHPSAFALQASFLSLEEPPSLLHWSELYAN